MPHTHIEAIVATAERAGDGESEDRIFLLPQAVIVLDGATSVELGPGSGGWYADMLGRRLARQLASSDGLDLRDVLAEAIASLAVAHNLRPGRAPSAAVTILRWTAQVVEGLVLCDTSLALLSPGKQTNVLHDDRLHKLDHPHRAAYLEAIRTGSAFDRERLRHMQAFTREYRNRPGGYWVAEAVPEAANEAVRGIWPREEVAAALLATDGAAAGVDTYRVLDDWAAGFAMAKDRGVEAMLDLVHQTELGDPQARRWPRFKTHDDKALAFVQFLREAW
ncbi:hypothetical protein AB0F17_59760 [Nonomuraea sp. NPDC026600]|uniref:hypothetical protein n=1 Tax=Nonomuraea sp. NPDC026600 TaxID=3155363 RepID=UPI0033C993C6